MPWPSLIAALALTASCAGGPAGSALAGPGGTPPAPSASTLPAAIGEATPVAPPPEPAGPTPSLALPNFYRRLAELRQHDDSVSGGEHVRIAWFGDSHTAADFMTGAVRKRLQHLFGNGGPGFVSVGTGLGRHEDVASERSGKWRRLPASPASHSQQLDGMYGLQGTRAVAGAYAASAKLSVRRPREIQGSTQLRWELVFRPRTKRLNWTADMGQQEASLAFDGEAWQARGSELRVRGSQLFGWVMLGPPDASLRVGAPSNDVDVFGAFAEYDAPGVVLDTLGINGARIRTLEGWHEGTWLGELAERDPALVVLAYGTNELGDRVSPERYRPYYDAVLSQIATAAPDAECLLVGPTDRRGADGHSMARVAALDDFQRSVAQSAGCAYFSFAQAMEAEGGYGGWAAQSPSLAGSDGVHLTVRGYEVLAERFMQELLDSFTTSTGMALAE